MNRSLKRSNSLSALDKRILNRIQEDIPFEKKPWDILAGELDVKEDILLDRVALLKKKGIIRRISAVFSPGKVSFASTLVAVKTTSYNIARVAKKINSYPEVTHNYRRDGEYDIWFTLVAKNKKRIAEILRQLKRDKNIEMLSEFPAVKLFKINVRFHV